MSLKDRILAADDIGFEDVDVPEWGEKVRVRGLSGTQRDAYEARSLALKRAQGDNVDVELKLQDFRSRMLVHCLHDPDDDSLIFSLDDAASLGGKSGAVIDRLFDIARNLSGMGNESKGEAAENLEPGLNVGSTSG